MLLTPFSSSIPELFPTLRSGFLREVEPDLPNPDGTGIVGVYVFEQDLLEHEPTGSGVELGQFC